jgi:transposase
MQAIHGGKATNDTIDAHKIAVLLRGGMLPQASVSPAAMRATRDLLRRRMPLMRTRAARLAHIQHTNSQSTLPEMGKTLASKGHRDGVAARFLAPAVHKSVEVDLALIDHDDRLLRDVARTLVQTAKQHHAQALYRRQSVPGIGQILRWVLLYAMHALTRFPRVQDCVSSWRLVTCAKESAGKRDGT